MHSRIDNIEMSPDDHRTLKASGRITWDSDEVSATFIVTIVQMKPQGRLVYAVGRSARTFRRADGWWEADATIRDADDGFQFDIPVTGWAVASVKETSGTSEPYPWETDNLTIDRSAVAVSQ